MKRRADELHFGARTPQRIITTQHSSTREYNIFVKWKSNAGKKFNVFKETYKSTAPYFGFFILS